MVDETVKMISICGFEGICNGNLGKITGREPCFREPDIPLYSSIAQSVEHAAVNRAVVGSSPTRGAFFVLSDEPDDW